MNEQIKELARQAGFDVELLQLNSAKGIKPIAEVLAELVIKECCKVLVSEVDKNGNICNHGRDAILEHFGFN
jgi:hypothetical protein